ncbi:putative phosphoglycerate mutase family protein [Calocera cornea HHB12733]|uniref:Putative phosphoglycerate mutase family protein n=1 Tax=Calocera cornea HHB12733 TaxID=1353952 RepID=A0A165KAN3_9BASI|nr:putative phosphoglycerate mutase family protein [Calocera cornea HHB12733]
MKLLVFVLVFGTAVFAQQYQYLIRHGEKPANGSQGLTVQGEERAQCLTTVFGPSSAYNIGYIMAETPKSNGDRTRPLETVTPLAEELGLTVDISCDRDDPDCVAAAVAAYQSTEGAENVLICWEHGELTDIATSLGVADAPEYPDADYNLIWTVTGGDLISTTSEDCPGLDTD